ncbi:MAG: acyl-CoA dehydrogenase [Gammaproteobacteria bacterium]|nr:acyl-CoA dehydrogenase [Gammaproteobacteria bacterium]
MDLQYTPKHHALRTEARAWLEANVPREPLPSYDTAQGFEAHRLWEAKLHSGRWSMVTWPQEYGGRGLDLIEWLIFEEEYYRVDAPARVNQNGVFLFGPTLMEYGTAEQKSRFLPRLASGADIWAQVWSEPQAGSDLAALRATAIHDGDEYIINGHKIWSTRAVYADWGFGLFRTDGFSERHRGLSYVVVPLRTPGVTIRGIPQLDGESGFAEIFFKNVRVPVANRIGDEGQGWSIAMATAGFERGLMLRSPARFQRAAQRLIELYRRAEQQTAPIDPGVAATVTQCWMDAEAYALSTYMTASRLIAGGTIGAEASLNKIFWSELDLSMHRAALAILGARAELRGRGGGESGAPAKIPDEATRWMDGFLFSLAGPIYAGANEIQRNIIAERVLGMPKG